MTYRLALIGFGTVGQGLADILVEKADWLKSQYGFEAQVTAICTKSRGSLYHPDGLDLERVLSAIRKTGSLAGYSATPGLVRDWDGATTIQRSNADVVVETTWTDLGTGQPALDYIRSAFQNDRHVVTSNKGPIALSYKELKYLAERKHLYLGIEGTVMAGTPALRLAQTTLAGCHVSHIHGILNGTSNFILTRMEGGAAYSDALEEAHDLGYAEADPTADVEGYDALAKLLILANVVMDTPIAQNEVALRGITNLTVEDIQQAAAQGKHWKQVAHVGFEGSEIQAGVEPLMISADHPLANVSGANNAITYQTDLLGDVTLVGPGAGPRETGFALLSDLLELQRTFPG